MAPRFKIYYLILLWLDIRSQYDRVKGRNSIVEIDGMPHCQSIVQNIFQVSNSGDDWAEIFFFGWGAVAPTLHYMKSNRDVSGDDIKQKNIIVNF